MPPTVEGNGPQRRPPGGWRGSDGFEDFSAFRGEAGEEFGGVSVAVTGAPPGWAVAVDDDAAFAGVGAGAGDHGRWRQLEEEGVAFFEVDFDGTGRGRPCV